jgi:hypothetical protein
MSAQTDAALQSAVATLQAAAPLILGAALASNPNAAAIAQIAPVALQFLQTASLLHNAGAMTSQQLADLFSTIGNGVQTTHNAWAAMNAADAVEKPLASA